MTVSSCSLSRMDFTLLRESRPLMLRPNTLKGSSSRCPETCGAEKGNCALGLHPPTLPEGCIQSSTSGTGCHTLNFSPSIFPGCREGRCLRTVPSLLHNDLQPISCTHEGGECLLLSPELTANPMFPADISVKGEVGVTPQDPVSWFAAVSPRL